MATDTERLQVQMSADIRRLEKEFLRAQAAADKTGDNIVKGFDKSGRQLNQSFGKLGDTLRTAFAAIAVGALVKDASRLADTYTAITNQLRSYADILGDTNAAQKRLVDTAVSGNANLEASAAVLTAAARAARDLGRSGDDVFDFTEAVGKGASIANTGASAVAGAITQLGQAVASPSVQLGEFNSIIEGTPRLAQAFADGIERAGGSVAKLRKLIGTGQVSGSQLFEGLLTQLPKLRQEFAAADTTIADSFTNLKTRITAYVGEANEATGVTKSLVPIINALANNVDAFADTLVVALVALTGALAGAGVAALARSIGAATAAVLTQRAAMALVAAEAARLAIAQGALTASNAGLYLSALKAGTSINVLGNAARLGAAATGALRVALAAVGGPLGLIGIGVALLALELSKYNRQADIAQKVAREYAPQLERIETATAKLATATGALAEEQRKSAKAALEDMIAKFRLAKANIALADSQLKLRESELQGDRSFSELSRLDAQTQEGVGAGLAQQAGRIARQRAELAELGKQIDAQIDRIAAADRASRQLEAPQPTADPAGGGATAATPDPKSITSAKDIKALAADLLGLSEKALAARDALADAEGAARDFQISQREDAESFLDRIPGSARRARQELEELRQLVTAGIFRDLGEERGAAQAEAQLLEEIAFAAGDATEALAELARINNLTAEEAVAAARRIREAAEAGREARDESLGRIFRIREIKDDLKSALREAFKTGDYAEIFEQRIADALERASDRVLDRSIDALFGVIGGVLKGGKKGGGKNIFGDVLSSVLGSIFGGGRAGGGSMIPGKFYLTGERGPELVTTSQNAFVLPNNILQALASQPRAQMQAVTQQLNIAYTIDLAGANGDATIRAIARAEAQRGVLEGLKIADKQAPARNARFNKLGS